MISLEKLWILTPLQKLPKHVGDLGKLIGAKGFKKMPKCKKSPNLVTLQTTTKSNHCNLGTIPAVDRIQSSQS